MLQLRGEKMSKSIGNIISIDEFLEHHSADSFRYLILNSAYRNPIIFSEEVLAQAERGLERLRSAFQPANPSATGAPQEVLDELRSQTETTREGFIASMDDDFNSAGALGQLFELVRMINIARDSGATDAELEPAQAMLRELTGVFGLLLNEPKADQNQAAADPFIQLLIDLRTELRKQKNWELSDKVRDRLAELGVVLEDGKDGTRWHWA